MPLIDIVNIIKTQLDNKQVTFEIVLSRNLSHYINERSLLERAYERLNREDLTPEREVKGGHLMRIPHSRTTSHMSYNNNALTTGNINTRNIFEQTLKLDKSESSWSKREM